MGSTSGKSTSPETSKVTELLAMECSIQQRLRQMAVHQSLNACQPARFTFAVPTTHEFPPAALWVDGIKYERVSWATESAR